MNEQTLKRLAALVSARNAVEEQIAAIIGRPALVGHLGEYLAAEIFDIELHASAAHKGSDGRFRTGSLGSARGPHGEHQVLRSARSEGGLDIRVDAVPGYYLVMCGSKAVAGS